MHALGGRRIVDLHDNKVIMIAAAVSRDSGWTAPRASLAREIRGQLNLIGNAALIGISNDVPSTSHIPNAVEEAETALCHATVSERVVQFGEVSLRQLLIHCAAQNFHRMLPAWTAAFFSADDRSGGSLVATLRAYARFDMNILKAADSLGIHPNTVYARLQRVFDVSGLEPRSFNALSDLLVVCDCARGRNAD
jgi:sugar diacid utilization regulator